GGPALAPRRREAPRRSHRRVPARSQGGRATRPGSLRRLPRRVVRRAIDVRRLPSRVAARRPRRDLARARSRHRGGHVRHPLRRVPRRRVLRGVPFGPAALARARRLRPRRPRPGRAREPPPPPPPPPPPGPLRPLPPR